MIGEEQKPIKPASLTPLTSEQAVDTASQMAKKGATYFNWKSFLESTKGLPPGTPLWEILAKAKKNKETKKTPRSTTNLRG